MKPMFNIKAQICSRCYDTIFTAAIWNDEKKMCKFCARESEAYAKGECLTCTVNKPVRAFWGQCKNCWEKQRWGD